MDNLSSSLGDYHGRASVSVSVPFNWESQPGTPKSKFHQNLTLPPLTPPPSYFYKTNSTKRPKSKTNYSKSFLLSNIFPKLRSRKASIPASPVSSSSPSNSRSSSSSSESSVTYYSVPSDCEYAGKKSLCTRSHILKPKETTRNQFSGAVST